MSIAKDVRKIKRVPLTHVDDVEAELRGQVLTEAFNNFGYCGDSFGAAGPLAKALYELNINPLDTASVKEYMASREMTIERDWRPWVHFGLCIASLAGSFLIVRTIWPEAHGEYLFFPWVFNSVVAGMFTNATFALGFDKSLPKKSYTWSWLRWQLGYVHVPSAGAQNNSLQGLLANASHGLAFAQNQMTYLPQAYRGYVPVHVLNIANQIKSKVPEADFWVDELNLTIANTPRPLPDPFMSVQLGSEKYYVAVWDEREFEAKM